MSNERFRAAMPGPDGVSARRESAWAPRTIVRNNVHGRKKDKALVKALEDSGVTPYKTEMKKLKTPLGSSDHMPQAGTAAVRLAKAIHKIAGGATGGAGTAAVSLQVLNGGPLEAAAAYIIPAAGVAAAAAAALSMLKASRLASREKGEILANLKHGRLNAEAALRNVASDQMLEFRSGFEHATDPRIQPSKESELQDASEAWRSGYALGVTGLHGSSTQARAGFEVGARAALAEHSRKLGDEATEIERTNTPINASALFKRSASGAKGVVHADSSALREVVDAIERFVQEVDEAKSALKTASENSVDGWPDEDAHGAAARESIREMLNQLSVEERAGEIQDWVRGKAEKLEELENFGR